MKMIQYKILFLYTELAGYTVNCLNEAIRTNKNIEIHVIRWTLNKEAPFEFKFSKRLKVKEKNKINLLNYYNDIKPTHVICSGWSDKEYIHLIKTIKDKSKKILMFDNYWEGTIKQYIGRIILPFTITKHFDYCWLPGEIQEKYAKKIGFKEEQIFLGFYATDLSPFTKAFSQNLSEKRRKFPKKFLYVGRYLKLKGILDLYQAFILFSKNNLEWELHCVGNGNLFESRIKHPKIFHHGFIQPEDLPKITKCTGVFIMPSHYDHWGMAVQEFAAAGYPLICSDRVGANCSFLKENRNGYIFKAKNVNSLLNAMNKIANLHDDKLFEFSLKSNELSKLYNTDTWNKTLNIIIHK